MTIWAYWRENTTRYQYIHYANTTYTSDIYKARFSMTQGYMFVKESHVSLFDLMTCWGNSLGDYIY